METREDKCKECGGDFISHKYTKQGEWTRFCSRKCQGKNQRQTTNRICKNCGNEFYISPSEIKNGDGIFCDNKCKAEWQREGLKGENNPCWKGGRFERKDGYIAINIGNCVYKLEHDLIMEKHIGRKLEPGEDVHHINRIRNDNRIENLLLLTKAEHNREHFRDRQLSKTSL